MTFDTRARRAAQGIHRAVEVMEMSSTKTPQRLTRFDQYRARTSTNKRIAALAVGIAVPLVLLIVAALVLGPDRDRDVPVTPAPTSTTPAPQTASSGHTFEAPFTYTVPQDWTFSGEGARYYSWDATDGSSTHLIVLSSVVAARSDCTTRSKRGVGRSSDAMTSWLSTHPGLVATTPEAIELGRAAGSFVDVELAADWDQRCRNGLVLVTAKGARPQSWSIDGDAKLRFYVLDLPGGDTVTIVVNVPHASDFQDVIAEATPLVESFDFHK
jgi:hypothetical protein